MPDRLLPALLLAAVSCTAPLAPRVARAQGTPATKLLHPEIRTLQLVGVNAVDPVELLASISTTASSCKGILFRPFCALSRSDRWWTKSFLDHNELRYDLLRIKVFYWKHGFRDAQVDTAVTPDRGDGDEVRVVFHIEEGPPTLVSVVRVERPVDILPDAQVAKSMLLRAGHPLDLVKLDSSRVLFQSVLWDLGYADARLDTATVVDSATHIAQVLVRIDPRWLTHVASINVRGNERVTTRTIRTSLSFKEGDLYRRREVETSQRRLWDSQLFRRVAIAVPQRGDSLKHVQVTVAEAPLSLARVSGGFNTADFLQVDARYSRFNFIGGARRLDLQMTFGNLLAQQLNGTGIFLDVVKGVQAPDSPDAFLRPTWLASAEFTQPWVFSPLNSFGISVFSHRRSAPSVYIDRGFGSNVSFTRTLTERAPVSLTYHFEVTGVDAADVYFCTNYGVCDPRIIAALRGNQKLSPATVSAVIDRANDPFSPSQGYNARVELEHASGLTASDFRYNRAFTDDAAYLSLGKDRVLAGHLRAGWVGALSSTAQAVGVEPTMGLLSDSSGAILHPRKRFYAGGARSVRGFGENQLGPRVLTLPASKLAFCTGAGSALPSPSQLAACDLSSDLAHTSLRDRDFFPRPLGGSTLVEGSVEIRVPIWNKISGAAFIDGAVVGVGSLREAIRGANAITPGFGARYRSPVGPIRVDLGINPSRGEDLTVVTEALVDGQRRIMPLQHRDASGNLVATTWRYNPAASHGGLAGVLNRLTLHLSIGQAY